MSKPTTPELDLILTQLTALQAISAGADWHTDIGERVYLGRLTDDDPPLHAALDSVVTDAGEDLAAAVCTVTWFGIVPLDDPMTPGSDLRTALLVQSDMRAALVGACATGTHEVAASVARRDERSNYAVVTVTTQTPIITEGRFNG